jgi:hypothetical protein
MGIAISKNKSSNIIVPIGKTLGIVNVSGILQD